MRIADVDIHRAGRADNRIRRPFAGLDNVLKYWPLGTALAPFKSHCGPAVKLGGACV